MHEARIGKIGSLDVRLAPPTTEPPAASYQRRYVPVTPASREIVGADTKVAADTTIAEWHIDDWSAGEGDLQWKDRGRYAESTAVAPKSDGSVLVTGFAYEQLKNTGGGTNFVNAEVMARGAGRLLAAADMSGKLYEWNDTNEEWDELWDIGGTGTDNVVSIAADAGVAYTNNNIYVAGSDDTIRQVLSASNSTWVANFNTGSGSNSPILTSFNGILYGLRNSDLLKIDSGTAETTTLVADITVYIDRYEDMTNRLTVSDVGPVWVVPLNNGRTYVWEYNAADDVAEILTELPKDIQPYDIAFYSGIYFVALRFAAGHALSGDAYLYYQVGGQRGMAGPFRSVTGVTASKPLAIAGVVGDRLMVYYDTALWAYDLTTGGISQVCRTVTAPQGATTYGSDVFFVEGATAHRALTAEFDTAAAAELTTGRHDFGYLGLLKTLTKVTVSCEDALAASETVGLAYSVDGGSFTTAAGTMVATNTTKTWTISSSSSTVRGVEFELKLLLKANTSTSSPKVMSVTAEAVGSEDRIEWVLALDLSDNNEQHGQVTLDGLKALKTAHAVVSFTDPWQVLDHTAAETFDVTVEEVNLPMTEPGAYPQAVVRLRGVATV